MADPVRLNLLTFTTLTLLGTLAACTTAPKAAPTPVAALEPPTQADLWQRVASSGDVERIERLGPAWTEALTDARVAGFRRDVAEEGDLLKPAASLPRPAPTPGSYSCRLVRVGNVRARGKAFERFKPFFCYVEVAGEHLTLVKQTGSQRPAGRLWEDDDAQRMIFLGSVALASEEQPLAYGENPKRDMAGVMERIAPFRWRLVVPWPQAPSKLDVYELTPVPEQPKTT
jgi:hypothetical protein